MYKDIRLGKKQYSKIINKLLLYKLFIKNYPEYKKSVSYKEFSSIYSLIIEEYKKEVSTNPHGVRLPFYMGDICIKYIPSINPNRNFTLLKNNIDTEHLNLSTNGKQAKAVWTTNHAKNFNKYLGYLGFRATRSFSKLIHNSIKNTPELFRTNKYTNMNINKIIKAYNESKLKK